MPSKTPRSTRKAAAIFAAAIAVVGVLVAPATATASPTSVSDTASDCVPLAIMAFRGDGEHPGGVDALDDPFTKIGETRGWEGQTIHRALRAYEKVANPLSAASVPVIAVGDENDVDTIATGYPAKTLFSDGALIAPVLLNSAARGVEEGASRMLEMWADADPGCARTQFIIIGYSQGAIAARGLAETYPADVAGTVLFADPLQLGDSVGNTGDGSAGNGAVRTGIIPTAQVAADRFYDLPFTKSSLCHEEDPVCNFDLWRLIKASYEEPVAHSNYVDDLVEANAKGLELANLVADTIDAPALARDVPPMDIMFIMNLYAGRNGSNYERDFLIQSLDTLSDYLETNPNTRVSVQVLGGVGLDPTSDIDEIVRFITTVPDTSVDWPRRFPHPYIEAAIDDPTFFRPGADQVIIGVKQYPSDQPDFEATLQTMIEDKAAVVRPASVSERGSTMAGVTTRIFNAPGAADPDDTWFTPGYAESSPFEAIYAKVFHNTRAVIGYPSTIVAGQTLTVSSEGSTGTDFSKYFQLGTPNTAGRSASPTGASSTTGSLTATTPGEQILSLTVTSASGETSTVEAVVHVLDPAELVIPVSPATGAPASGATVSWATTSHRAGTVSVNLPAGAAAEVSLVAAPTDGSDAFVKPGQVRVGQVGASSVSGTRTGALNVPAAVSSGSYLLLVRESTGNMVSIPVTL